MSLSIRSMQPFALSAQPAPNALALRDSAKAGAPLDFYSLGGSSSFVAAEVPLGVAPLGDGRPKVRFAIDDEKLDRLGVSDRTVRGQTNPITVEEMQTALELFRALASNPELVRSVKRAAGVGNPESALAGEQWVGPQALREVARLARELGHPLTRAGVSRFKRERRLSHGAEMGPTTASAYAEQLTRGGAPVGEDYDSLRASVVRRHGDTAWRTGPHQVNIVALRGRANGRSNGNAFNEYNDTIVVAWQDARGAKHTKSFRATVDPGVRAGGSNDGVAHVREGHWTYQRDSYRGGRRAMRTGDVVRVDRDVNHNGRIDESERNRRVRSGAGILIHQGGSGSRVGGTSEGCFAIHGGPRAFDAFWSLVQKDPDGGSGRVGVTLIDATRRAA
ncbi:MAG: hypothetical protein HY791_20225 [Deltaproteobacteria bacterium]|nr:hypothetical protein [Deltaproteobacteria bacterium]